jgi:methionyl-tRNA formyltransferase
MSGPTIVMLAGEGESTNIIYNSLKEEFAIERVIIEEPVPKSQFLKRRVKKLGLVKVFGQVLFQVTVVPYLRKSSRARIQEIKESWKLDAAPIDESKVTHVESVNSDETVAVLQKLRPEIVIINGTRIVSTRILNCVPAKFINMHAGITPLYRGVHGAYWALVENNREACGVTVHFVDPGIDTGGILQQEIISPIKTDNFVTYPLLQLAAGIPLLKRVLRELSENQAETRPAPEGRSKLWSHPTLSEYIWYRIRRGIS